MTLEEAGHRINPDLPADSLTTQLSRACGPRGESWGGGKVPPPNGAGSWSKFGESGGGFSQVHFCCLFSAFITSLGTTVCFSKVQVGF